MPTAVRPSVREFFERYERASDTLDTSAINEAFHDTFLNLDPGSAKPVRREQLIAALPMRERLFASIGATGMALSGMEETPLDDLHTLVETQWTVRFDPSADQAPLILESAFLLRLDGGRWRIVLYLNHHDVGALIAARRS